MVRHANIVLLSEHLPQATAEGTAKTMSRIIAGT